MIMPMKEKPVIIDINAENRPSSFSIRRDGKKITLTNAEVRGAIESLLHRISNDVIQYFAEVYEEELPKDRLRLLEDNIVRDILNKIPREILEQANTSIGGEDAPPVDYLFGMDS